MLKATISDIARELNTTPATVSRALSNHPRISAKTKKSVHEAALKLNYKRNKIASSLRSGKTHLIGVIIPSAEINFWIGCSWNRKCSEFKWLWSFTFSIK